MIAIHGWIYTAHFNLIFRVLGPSSNERNISELKDGKKVSLSVALQGISFDEFFIEPWAI